MKGRLVVLLAAMALLASVVAGHASSAGIDAGVLQTYWAEGKPSLPVVNVTLEIRAYGPGGGKGGPSFSKGWLKEHKVAPGDDYEVDWTDVSTGHRDVEFQQCEGIDPDLDLDEKTDVWHANDTRRAFDAELESDRHFMLCIQGPGGQIREKRFDLYDPEGERVGPTHEEELQS